MTLQEAKHHYINKHPLRHLTIAQLKIKAKTKDIPVYGDKAQILQCFDQSELLSKLFRINKRKEVE